MALFQQSVLNSYISKVNEKFVNELYNKFQKHFGNGKIQENIRKLNETKYQQGFLTELLVNVFGYIKNPNENFNLDFEVKNENNNKKADAAIYKDKKVTAVIELKDTHTPNLSSVVQQAFEYKNSQRGCKYVITSNYELLRFYIDDNVEYEEFDLFNMAIDRFKVLYLCLYKENLINDLPYVIKSQSNQEEKNVTDKLYKDYSQFRTELYQNIKTLNPEYDEVILYKKTQKLLDRLLFIFFAEDRELLYRDFTLNILDTWTLLKEAGYNDTLLYDVFKKHFGFINDGHKTSKHDIFAYNGGMFASDEILDNIKIDDKILLNYTKKLSDYNFATEIDVNILGHIFEHSLVPTEEIQAKSQGIEIKKKDTKKKQDGVFYTPPYITKYIIENTIGVLCEEKKKELNINDITIKNAVKKEDKKKLYKRIDEYRNWLLSLKICDPACGSGAFLNEALDFLIKEHNLTNKTEAQVLNSSIVYSYIEESILENNIYGVDINEEAVEIAKLSLWLKVAKKDRKLSNLNNNIKCGNSLIDDPNIAGDKAFNWQKEFPTVFENGGFDVVIGNPPYVVLSSFKDKSFIYLQSKFKTSFGRLNTFALFIEQITTLTNKNSKIGIIIPDSLCLIDYYSNLRKYLLDSTSIEQIIELGDGIFTDATVPAIILLLGNKKKENIIKVGDKAIFTDIGKIKTISQNYYYTTQKYSFNLCVDDIFLKLNRMIDSKMGYSLKDLIQIKIGICTGNNFKHIADNKQFVCSKKMLQGKDITKYHIAYNNKYINYDRKILLRARDEDIFLKREKLLMRQTSDNLILAYDNDQYYTIDSLFILYAKDERINIKYLLAILNSKLINRHYQKLNPETGRVFAQVKIDFVNEIPIILANNEIQTRFIHKTDIMLSLNKEFQEGIQRFHRVLERRYNITKLTNKLNDWYLLSYVDFIIELNKKKVKLKISDEAELEDYFIQEQLKAIELKNRIVITGKEIDAMVYELYELTPEEIAIVEAN
ncbi:MAG: hypothetical protein A2X12_03715 [Bacteroidetes bacterium GWE2_29_8]|nr:MAG: hypothetical protein A2X12_03715 [Bacteroidetes bacterium GWE2_29_8]